MTAVALSAGRVLHSRRDMRTRLSRAAMRSPYPPCLPAGSLGSVASVVGSSEAGVVGFRRSSSVDVGSLMRLPRQRMSARCFQWPLLRRLTNYAGTVRVRTAHVKLRVY